jgi:hypothetical protein
MSRRKVKTSPGPYLIQAELLAERVPAANPFPYCLPSIRNLGTPAILCQGAVRLGSQLAHAVCTLPWSSQWVPCGWWRWPLTR